MREQLAARLQSYGQLHLLDFYDQLDPPDRQRLVEQIEALDWELLSKLASTAKQTTDWTQLAARARPPRAIRLGRTDNPFTLEAALSCGEEALRAGRVGMILVAGGQGSRLGFEHPKGMFPVGPLSGRTLFQVLVEHLRAVARRYQTSIPLYVMTSPATHAETVAFLEREGNFGLPAEDLKIFTQGVMPAVDAQSHKVLLAEPSQLSLSPDGHGGMLAAFAESGCLEDAKRRGISQLFYGQVDNPLLQVCSPALLGYHLLAQSEMTTQVVPKEFPLHRVGNVVEVDGCTQIIEYSDLPEAMARKTNPDGSLFLWAGSIAVHVFDLTFLRRMCGQAEALPFHQAHKQVPYVDADGKRVKPGAPNAIKYERFIFDLLPAARNAIVVEARPAEAFAPVKNASGSESETRETAQAAMVHWDRQKLRSGGVVVDEGVEVEVNPLWALDAAEVKRKVSKGLRVSRPRYFR